MKILKSFALILIIFSLFALFSVKAQTATYTTDDGSYNYTTDVQKTKTLYSGTEYINDSGYTTRGSTKFDQEVHMLFQKSNASKGTKVVTWAIYDQLGADSTHAFSRNTLIEIAKDYEKNHPGWKVLGGVNADQYYPTFGTKLTADGSDVFYNQPYYPMMADGENWFSITPLGQSNNIVGFKNDGSNSPFVNGSRSISGLKINVYQKDGTFIEKFAVDALNPKNFSNGTAIYTLYNQDQSADSKNATKEMSISSENDLYIVENANKAFVSNSADWSWYKSAGQATNAFFGKGEVSATGKTFTLKRQQFAIETTNQSLLTVLKNGNYIVAQYEFDDEIQKNCQEGIGYHTVQRKNGQDNNVANTYNSRGYPRSVFGTTSDGTIVLIASDGKTAPTYGMFAQEINALCKAYDIKEAYQMDGGGSVTMIVRSDDGSFTTVTKPADGSNRHIFSGLFFVARDIDADITVDKIEKSSLTLNVTVNDFGGYINVEGVYLNLVGRDQNGRSLNQTKKVINNQVSFDDLASYSQFEYRVMLKTSDSDEFIEALTTGKISTAKITPIVKYIKLNYVNNTLTLTASISDPNISLIAAYVSLDNGKTFQIMKSGLIIVFSDYTDNPAPEIVLKIAYNIQDEKGRQEMIIDEINLVLNYLTVLEIIGYNSNSVVKSLFE